MNPTSEQIAIAEAAAGSSNLMIKALAGTGKTSTLEYIAPLLQAPSILALAFNVKIKTELSSRLPSTIDVKTLNGLGYGAWFSFFKQRYNVDGRKTFQLSRAFEQQNRIRLSKEEYGDISDLIAAAKALGFVPKGAPFNPKNPIIQDNDAGLAEVFDWADVAQSQELEVIFRKQLLMHINATMNDGLMDFNDQIWMPIIYGAPFPQYDTVLVDEAQDLSYLNHLMIEKTCSRRFIVVGDENQAIYAFRGAMSNSMDAFKARHEFKVLPLTMTFRCGKAIVARAQSFVPEYRAHEGNPEGIVEAFPLGEEPFWTKADIPDHCAIICRNNAPLINLAFKLLIAGRGVQMLGSDIGKSLERSLDKATKGLTQYAPKNEVLAKIDAYFRKEISKAKSPGRQAGLEDRRDCLIAIASNTSNLADAKRHCYALFENKDATVTLSSGHKSKGLEWDSVIHLDSHLIPSRYASSEEELRQEDNLRYVIETRAKRRLILANSEDFR